MGPALFAVLLLAASPSSPLKTADVAPAVEPSVNQPSPARIRKDAEESSVEMKAFLKKLLGRIEKARSDRDIVLLNCLNEKLTQVKALMRVADQAGLNLQEFLAKDQIEGAIHERRKIMLAEEKVKTLTAEAETCLGENGSSGGRTVVDVEKPDYSGDPTHIDQPENDQGLQTPPSASPYN